VVNGRHVKDPSERATREHNQPLVDKPTFMRVQQRWAMNQGVGRQRAEGPTYALAGVVRCACGKYVHGTKDSRTSPAITCPDRKKGRTYRLSLLFIAPSPHTR
jgi:hypothetical protein